MQVTPLTTIHPSHLVDKVADFRLLVKAPEDDNTGLFTQISKLVGSWTQAVFTARTNYRLFAKPVLTATYGHLKTDLLKVCGKLSRKNSPTAKIDGGLLNLRLLRILTKRPLRRFEKHSTLVAENRAKNGGRNHYKLPPPAQASFDS